MPKRFAKLLALGLLLAVSAPAFAGEVVNLYSYRQPFLIKPFLAEFTKRTGIAVNVVFEKKGMLERLKAEAENTPADAVLTVDIARLADMKAAGLLKPLTSKVLEANVPANLRDKDNQWFALTTRARIIIAHKDRVKPGEIKTYEDLAAARMKGRVCIRSGKHYYNILLLASMIAHNGEAETEKFLRGLKANLARKPQGNDRAQAKAIYEGQCDVGIINNYYMGKMITNEKKPEQKKWAAALRVILPNQEDRGTHINISGAAVVKYAKNSANAVKLLEFLAGDFAQKMYADQNFEYPVKAGVKWSALLSTWGPFKADNVALTDVAKYRRAAARLVDKVDFDH